MSTSSCCCRCRNLERVDEFDILVNGGNILSVNWVVEGAERFRVGKTAFLGYNGGFIEPDLYNGVRTCFGVCVYC